MATYLSWVVICECCCGDEQVHVESTDNRMRCGTCSCFKARPPGAGVIAIRVMIKGAITIKVLEDASEVARALGADDLVLLAGTKFEHYLDVPAEGILARLAIQNLTNGKHRS